jgi:surfeit locus 1 family protein
MKFKRTPLAAYVCLLPLLVALGVWQLNRAEEKRALLALQKQQQSEESVLITGNSPDNLDALLYRSVKVTGHYDSDHQFLLDNQVHQGKAGFFVLTPLLLKQGKKVVLVNRCKRTAT